LSYFEAAEITVKAVQKFSNPEMKVVSKVLKQEDEALHINIVKVLLTAVRIPFMQAISCDRWNSDLIFNTKDNRS